MNRALFISASGMAAQQQLLDVVANNLANADVAGFKTTDVTFDQLVAPGTQAVGTAVTGSHPVFVQGKIDRSDGPFDVALEGDGYFQLRDAHGAQVFTRDGRFERRTDGTVGRADGSIIPDLRIPANARALDVRSDGTVVATVDGRDHLCGRIRVVRFPSPEHLAVAGSGTFVTTPEAGRETSVACGRSGETAIRFHAVERSNVSIVEAMMQILAAQRAYEANAKGVQAADEMMRIADNLQRG